ncbi:MAG: thiamine phosphate synthase, partial [Muribaculaceae bacterium]|nr:thiamine phosphate synthase [Muribaculaceae bacterium]
MKKIVISYPDFFTGEADELISLLRRGDVWRVHIRKPGHSADDVRRLIEALPKAWRYKISIHDHPELAKDYELGGVHLNSRNSTIPHGWRGMISRSFHTLDEIGKTNYDYAFLSPIFPSISKPGYSSTLSPDEIKAAVNDKIFALGGVTENRLDEVERMGFGGAAFLGSVWLRHPDMDAFRLQFITHPVADRT